MKRLRLSILVLSTIAACIANAQDKSKEDSLWKLLQKSSTDTNRVLLLLQYGELFETGNTDTAMFYYKQAKALAEQLQYKKGLSAYTSYSIVILNNQGKFREALELCKENIQRWEGTGNKQEMAAAYINVGSEWQYLSDLETAADSYIKALQYAEQINHQNYQRVANNNLASVFNSLQQYDKGLYYALKALQIAQALKNEYAIASSLINIATSETSLKKNDSALLHFKQVEMLGESMQDDIIRMDGWLGQADNFKALQKWAEAEKLYKNTITLAKKSEAQEYILYGCMGISDLLLKTKQYAAAETYITPSIPLALSLGTRLELKDLYLRASELNEAIGNAGAALTWHKKFVLLNDSLINEKSTANINLQEIKYETSKKQTQIKELETEKKVQALTIKQKNIFNWVMAGSALLMLLFAILGIRNHKQKQLLQLQRITELEKEKQLLATEAVLKGQEEERTRLAKDLHDGLGGMLSGVKFSFNNMRDNLIMTPENLQAFQRGLDMLDSSITELRRVAHSMMPEALMKFGLNAALKDFCTGINSSGVIKVVYQSYGIDDLKIDQAASVTIYRIVQELLNNVIKHAAATKAIVQVNKEADKLLITVEDDGKGFDTVLLKESKGIGWTNIQNRLDYLNAKLDLQSAPGVNGTSVNIEIDI
ncbi:MAG: sensor histidine kinase [Chitinophagaceae bacterium]|nr:sensor histidine kinase [Chitinophagaceae bacterium]